MIDSIDITIVGFTQWYFLICLQFVVFFSFCNLLEVLSLMDFVALKLLLLILNLYWFIETGTYYKSGVSQSWWQGRSRFLCDCHMCSPKGTLQVCSATEISKMPSKTWILFIRLFVLSCLLGLSQNLFEKLFRLVYSTTIKPYLAFCWLLHASKIIHLNVFVYCRSVAAGSWFLTWLIFLRKRPQDGAGFFQSLDYNPSRQALCGVICFITTN